MISRPRVGIDLGGSLLKMVSHKPINLDNFKPVESKEIKIGSKKIHAWMFKEVDADLILRSLS